MKTRILRHRAAHFAPIFIFQGSFERSQFPLSNEPKILQIGQEKAELWPKTTQKCVRFGFGLEKRPVPSLRVI